MTEAKGLNHHELYKLSQRVRKAWDEYFYTFRTCQQQIHFTAEEKSNYIPDLLNYLDDTLNLLSTIRLNDDYLSSLYDIVAILQFMFVQQDLIDQLLTVFKLPQSSGGQKARIRNLRNELIGHPISKDGNGLVSTVFITAETRGTTLEYARYHRDVAYRQELIRHDWISVFKDYEEYLRTKEDRQSKNCTLEDHRAIFSVTG